MFYIGFVKFSEFICALDLVNRVYLAPITIINPGDPISTATASLIASQVRNDHLIYCKVDVSRWSEIYGSPFGPTDIERAGRATYLQNRMWEFMVERLRASDADLTLYEGSPSFPKDLMLIPGHIDGITYDSELHDFIAEP